MPTRTVNVESPANAAAKAPIEPAEPAEPARIVACNQALIVGELVTEPERRELPGGLEAASFSLTVRIPGQQTTSVPLNWYGPPKRIWQWKLGSLVVASGPVVRRFYRAAGVTSARTEVVVEHAQLATARTRSQAIVKAVADRVADTGVALLR